MLPQPLTAQEEFFLCDDRPAYPMTVVFRLRFSGRLDRAAFEAALQTAAQRHPLLRATVSHRRHRLSWIDNPDWTPTIQWDAPASEYGYPRATYLDVRQEPGTRFWAVDCDGVDHVIAQVHHASTDALGMCQVIEDVLIEYALRTGEDSPPISLPRLDKEWFCQRGAPDMNVWRFFEMLPNQSMGLAGAWDSFGRAPASLAPNRQPTNSANLPEDFPASRTFEFDRNDTRDILAAAKAARVTVNDLLARDLFLAIRAWREKLGYGADDDWLRLAIPVNLRSEADQRLPMANSLSLVFLDQRSRDVCDGRRLLRSVHRQMQLIKNCNLAWSFVLGLAAARQFPGVLSQVMPGNRCMATCLFSNVGVILNRTPLPRQDGRIVAGNVTLDGIEIIPPVRPGTGVAIFTHTYANRLNVMAHHDPRMLTDDQAADLLGSLVARIRNSAG